MMTPRPLSAVAFIVQRLLEIEDPAVAGATIVRVLDGLRDELIERGWTEHDASGVVLQFGHEVTTLLAAIRDRHGAVLH